MFLSRPTLVKQKHSIQQQAFFPDEQSLAHYHFKELGRELNDENNSLSITQQSRREESATTEKKEQDQHNLRKQSSLRGVIKQASLNDEIFSSERQSERRKIKENLKKQQSLPESQLVTTLEEEKPKSLRESIMAVNKKFDIFREGFTKLRNNNASGSGVTTEVSSARDEPGSIKVGFTKMLNRWKTESDPSSGELTGGLRSFTEKRGVNIDPINVFSLRRDQSLDTATRRGLFHRKGS